VGTPLGRCQPRAAAGLIVRLWHILRTRFQSLAFRSCREADLAEELALHIEREALRAGRIDPIATLRQD